MPGGRRFLSLDDLDVVDAAAGGSQQVTLDEVQREPDLLHAVKRAIDQAAPAREVPHHRFRPTCY